MIRRNNVTAAVAKDSNNTNNIHFRYKIKDSRSRCCWWYVTHALPLVVIVNQAVTGARVGHPYLDALSLESLNLQASNWIRKIFCPMSPQWHAPYVLDGWPPVQRYAVQLPFVKRLPDWKWPSKLKGLNFRETVLSIQTYISTHKHLQYTYSLVLIPSSKDLVSKVSSLINDPNFPSGFNIIINHSWEARRGAVWCSTSLDKPMYDSSSNPCWLLAVSCR
jgi:hypothetical protein